MRSLLLHIFLLCIFAGHANDSTQYTLRINFLYGSKPAKGFKSSESKLFGGLKGGHVNIECEGRVLDFMPGKNPLLPEKKNPTGGFRLNRQVYWNNATDKWKTVIVPIDKYQYKQLQQLFDTLASHTPFDYAIFGVRCAAASYYVLSQLGLFEKISTASNIGRHFYPKLLRKKVLKWAQQNSFTVLSGEGRTSRKWETDKGVF